MSKYPTNFKGGAGWIDLKQRSPPRLAQVQIVFLSAGSTPEHPTLNLGIAKVSEAGQLVWADCPDDSVDMTVTHWKLVDNSPIVTLQPKAPWSVASHEPSEGEEVEIIYQHADGSYLHGFAYTRFDGGDEDLEEGTYWRWSDSHTDTGAIIREEVWFWKPMDQFP